MAFRRIPFLFQGGDESEALLGHLRVGSEQVPWPLKGFYD